MKFAHYTVCVCKEVTFSCSIFGPQVRVAKIKPNINRNKSSTALQIQPAAASFPQIDPIARQVSTNQKPPAWEAAGVRHAHLTSPEGNSWLKESVSDMKAEANSAEVEHKRESSNMFPPQNTPSRDGNHWRGGGGCLHVHREG